MTLFPSICQRVDITEDRGVTDEEAKDITRIAIDYVSKDSSVKVESKGKDDGRALWIYHK